MIALSRLNDSVFYVNPHQIEFMEETPDTVITMVSGTKFVVKEKIAEVVNRIVAYRARLVDERAFERPAFFGNEE